MFIQDRGGRDAVQVVRDEIIKTTSETNVKTLQRRGLIEFKADMDILTTKEELAEDLAKDI